MAKIFAKRGSGLRIKEYAKTPQHAKRLRVAIDEISHTDIGVLCKSPRVKKINIGDNPNLYAYKVSANERIVFSPVDGNAVVHDIVNVNSGKSMNYPKQKAER